MTWIFQLPSRYLVAFNARAPFPPSIFTEINSAVVAFEVRASAVDGPGPIPNRHKVQWGDLGNDLLIAKPGCLPSTISPSSVSGPQPSHTQPPIHFAELELLHQPLLTLPPPLLASILPYNSKIKQVLHTHPVAPWLIPSPFNFYFSWLVHSRWRSRACRVSSSLPIGYVAKYPLICTLQCASGCWEEKILP